MDMEIRKECSLSYWFPGFAEGKVTGRFGSRNDELCAKGPADTPRDRKKQD